MWTDSEPKLGWPAIAEISGVMMLTTSACTTAVNATPITTATARSTRLPRNKNVLNPFITPPRSLPASTPRVDRTNRLPAYAPFPDLPPNNSVLTAAKITRRWRGGPRQAGFALPGQPHRWHMAGVRAPGPTPPMAHGRGPRPGQPHHRPADGPIREPTPSS